MLCVHVCAHVYFIFLFFFRTESKDEPESDVVMQEVKPEETKIEVQESTPIQTIPRVEDKPKEKPNAQAQKTMLSLEERMTQFREMMLTRGVSQYQNSDACNFYLAVSLPCFSVQIDLFEIWLPPISINLFS